MRLTHLLTLAAVAGATTSAAAQTRLPSDRDVEIVRIPRSRADFGDEEHRAALGVGTAASGTLRDTLGLMVTSITRGSPAERAGLEEGNRIAAINGVSLRAAAADVEDAQMSGALTRRLTRELAKARPGDEVTLTVYREGRTATMRVKTADSDSLFRRREVIRTSRREMDDRPALGFSIGSTGSRRDTLGVLVVAVPDSTPAARAGLEEGNRIAAINGVNLRVSREDAGDDYLGSAKAQRLRREITQLTPGSEVTLRVYSNGQFRDVRMKVARAGDLPRHRGMMMFGGMGLEMPPMPPMPAMPAMPPMPALPRIPRAEELHSMHFELGPQIEEGLRQVGYQLERVRPEIDRVLQDLPRTLERIEIPDVRIDVDTGPRTGRIVRTTVM
jgi:S1-C subfamily serine protease